MTKPHTKIKQFFCTHWFDEKPRYQDFVYDGAIVCSQQKLYRVTLQPRVCSKCGLTETRRIGDMVFEGWE